MTWPGALTFSAGILLLGAILYGWTFRLLARVAAWTNTQLDDLLFGRMRLPAKALTVLVAVHTLLALRELELPGLRSAVTAVELLVLAYVAVDPPSHPLRGHRHLSQFRDRLGARAELFGPGAAHLPAGRAPRPAPCLPFRGRGRPLPRSGDRRGGTRGAAPWNALNDAGLSLPGLGAAPAVDGTGEIVASARVNSRAG